MTTSTNQDGQNYYHPSQQQPRHFGYQHPPQSELNLDPAAFYNYEYPESSLHEINSPIQEETDSGQYFRGAATMK